MKLRCPNYVKSVQIRHCEKARQHTLSNRKDFAKSGSIYGIKKMSTSKLLSGRHTTEMKVLLAVTLAIVLEICSAHICLLSPPQRGSMLGINKAGADDCFLTQKSCGGRTAGKPVEGLKMGENLTVTWQKNLDHYNKTSPGAFHVSLGEEMPGTMMTVLATVPDAGEPSLSLYSINVTIPSTLVARRPYVFQATYVPNNAGAPAVFYQCSDILIEG